VPEGLEVEPPTVPNNEAGLADADDPLLGLFRNQSALPADAFLAQLHKQRGAGTLAASASA